MAHSLRPVQRLPPELVRRIADQLVGIKEWVTISREAETPPPETPGYCPRRPARKVDFIGLRTLPSLATTSRFFLEPALDALWDTLPDYGILVHLLPKDALAVDVMDELESPNLPEEFRSPLFQYVSIVRPLTEDEVKRVEYYTPRVKRIQELCPLFPNHLRGHVTYESSVLAAFASHWSPEKPLFPNLRILDLSPATGQYGLYFRFFYVLFGPHLRKISSDCSPAGMSRFAKDVPPDDYQQMLQKLQESAPHLQHLKLYVDAPPYSSVIVSAMSGALRSFNHLVSARTGSLPITLEALYHLAELPYLEAIDVRLPDAMTERDVESLHSTSFDEFFPALRELRLMHHFNLAPISRIVQQVHSSRLEIIRVVILETSVPLDAVLHFLSVVLCRNDRESIKELGIQTVELAEELSPFTEQHLEPLFALRSLTTLSLRLNCPFSLSDTILGCVARAWPDIRSLELGPDSTQKDTNVTLAALVPFAQHCPNLQTLGFTLDADLSRLPVELRESRANLGSIPQRALRVLKVGRARIADESGVAAFLVDLFPRLSYVKDTNMPTIGIVLAQMNGGPVDEATEAEAKCNRRWRQVYDMYIPALARERGIDRGYSLDETEAHVMKAWHMGGKRRRLV
ncbi:hypothetical protein GSI_07806 [Ganoderma sinense ZZ0214-1]|uniref:F-box domain-containing protein n=1 Tax=Ganoderma sinense ZZ0214-1 TaxID=1077348 RepID=A0A2G8S7Z2_9APHY|nr:hypothetical protein GSI_07806 [Ganoderma sinense ZZ0214-1]